MMRRRLQALEARLALCAALLLVFVLPFRLLAGIMGTSAPDTSASHASPADVATGTALGRRVERNAGFLSARATCLVKAVALWIMLRRRGIRSRVRLGVRRDAGGLAAHAWLDVAGGTVLGGAEAEGFTAIADMGRQGARP
ncbi:lasso peptide biosynthesis B2 protein [Aquabacter cavernae]|uniref:lasso peptide biosynthesis B2 protein n=1 Tax=Aquabacter cavernae TaxID=2496029 RepID=UPI000F8C679B|nr:lasso peptide biosynthesis B2 protein [Aquabacter cavernae]